MPTNVKTKINNIKEMATSDKVKSNISLIGSIITIAGAVFACTPEALSITSKNEEFKVHQELNYVLKEELFYNDSYKINGNVTIVVAYPKNSFSCYGETKNEKYTYVDKFSYSVLKDTIDNNIFLIYNSNFNSMIKQKISTKLTNKLNKVVCYENKNVEIKYVSSNLTMQGF